MKNEQQIAKKIVGVLDIGAETIDAATAARLAAARQQAVAAMPVPAHASLMEPVLVGWGRLVGLSHHGGPRFWLPVLLLLVALMAGLASTMSARNNQPIDADALLLASDLPPEAFADKEFVAWLEDSSHL